MKKIVDYKCTFDIAEGMSGDLAKELDLEFPKTYLQKEGMIKLSKGLKEKNQSLFCEIPFCHTLESESMGASINYGDEKAGPRAKEYLTKSVSDLLDLPSIDFEKGRIYETLLAAKELREQGENVVFHISGPLTVMDALIDPRYIFKAMKKDRELAKKALWKMGDETLRFMQKVREYGIQMISYADSSGGVNILGPIFMQQMVDDFMYDFLKKVDSTLNKDMLIILCPKISLALVGTEKAVFEDVELGEEMSYGQACLDMIGQTRFLGQTCIKNSNLLLKDKRIKKVVLA